MFAPGYFDMIWASPPCAEYSRALTRRPRKLEEGNRTAIRTLELIRDLRPRFWCIDPQTGLLKRRPFMANLQWSDVTYCKYGYPYKKATRLWHNLPWEPQHGPCCARSRRAASFGCAAGHVPPQGRGRAKLPKPGAALQHPRGTVQGDRFGRQRSRGDSPRLVLGFLGFPKASTLACSFLQTPHSTAVSLP